MPEINPYQPSAETPAEEVSGVPPSQRVHFSGGFLAILAVGVIAGLGSAWLIGNMEDASAFYGPAVVWILALMATHALLRGSQSSLLVKSWLSLILALPACVLYYPVCVVSGFVSISLFGGKGYGPNGVGLAFASVFAFALVLFLFAYIVRAIGRANGRNHAIEQERLRWINETDLSDRGSAVASAESAGSSEDQQSDESSGPGNPNR